MLKYLNASKKCKSDSDYGINSEASVSLVALCKKLHRTNILYIVDQQHHYRSLDCTFSDGT